MKNAPTEPQDTRQMNGVATMAARAMRIPGDQVNRVTADLPDDQRSEIRWLHDYAWRHDLSCEDLGKEIGYNANTLYQVFTGRHQAGKENITESIRKYRTIVEARAGSRKIDFVETATSKRIWKVCEAALIYQRASFIFGDSQIGKTAALEEYTRTHNHGETIMIRVPTGGVFGHLLAEFAETFRISPQTKEAQLRRRIFDCFSPNMLLIVDEAQEFFSPGYNGRPKTKIESINFIREIHDRRKCGLVISAANVFRDEIESGTLKSNLIQLYRRRLAALQLPSHPTSKDLTAFAQAYGLPPAEGEFRRLQDDMVASEALGMWLTLLRMAATAATRDNRKLSWDDVRIARTRLARLES